MFSKDHVNGNNFIEIFELIKAHGEQYSVLFDQASYHTSRATKEYCHSNNITCILNPQYEPDLNPIEKVFLAA